MMNKQFLDILDRINDPNQVKNIWDTPNAVLLPAIVHIEERLERLEKLLLPKTLKEEKDGE